MRRYVPVLVSAVFMFQMNSMLDDDDEKSGVKKKRKTVSVITTVITYKRIILFVHTVWK